MDDETVNTVQFFAVGLAEQAVYGINHSLPVMWKQILLSCFLSSFKFLCHVIASFQAELMFYFSYRITLGFMLVNCPSVQDSCDFST